MKLPASVDTVAAMMTGAVANALLHWYETDRELSKEKLTEEITAVINAMHS